MAAKYGKRRESKCYQPPRLQLFLLSKKLRAGRAARVTNGGYAGGIYQPLHSRKTGVVEFEAKKKRMKKEKDRASGPYDESCFVALFLFPVSLLVVLIFLYFKKLTGFLFVVLTMLYCYIV